MLNDLDTPKSSVQRRSRWPVFLVALLAGQMLLVLGMVYVATSDRSVGVEPQYYENALHWDDHARQEQRNRELGWTIAAAVSDALGGDERRLTCRLNDRDELPLTDAEIAVTVFHNARSNDRITTTLTPTGDGAYFADMPMARAGLWELRFNVRRGADVFTSIRQISIAAGNGAIR